MKITTNVVVLLDREWLEKRLGDLVLRRELSEQDVADVCAKNLSPELREWSDWAEQQLRDVKWRDL